MKVVYRNADFDGDEMQINVGQSVAAQTELEEISLSSKQIISSAHSSPNVGLVQDGLVGVYLMSRENYDISRIEASQMLLETSMKNYDFFLKSSSKKFDCRQVISQIIPERITTNRKVQDKPFIVENGVFKEGILSKANVGAKKSNSLIHLAWDSYGPEESVNILDDMQKLANYFIHYNGFTVGIGDIHTSQQLRQAIWNYLDSKDTKIQQFITESENHSSKLEYIIYEDNIFSDLNTVSSEISEMVEENVDPMNNFHIMKQSGSKGDIMHFTLMSGVLGMQAYEGALMPKTYNLRTLPYFCQNDDQSESRGLIKQCFIDGQTFPSFYYHTKVAIASITESAMKTADSGYLQRKFIKMMEDINTKYDGTQRLNTGTIVQYAYGDQGIHPERQYSYKFDMFEQSKQKMENLFLFTKEQLKEMNDPKYDKEINEYYFQFIMENKQRLVETKFRSSMDRTILDDKFMIGVNIPRILDQILKKKYQKGSSSSSPEKLRPSYIVREINKLFSGKYLQVIPTHRKCIRQLENIFTKEVLLYALHEKLAPKRCIYEYKFSKRQFDDFIQEVINDYNNNVCEAGENIGVIAAQSIGEPLTQMTLNTFHKTSGDGGLVLTQGIARMREIANLTTDIKTPQMKLYLIPELQNDQRTAQNILSQIEYSVIDDIVDQAEVFYDPQNDFLKSDKIVNSYSQRHIFKQSTAQKTIQDNLNVIQKQSEQTKKINDKILEQQVCDDNTCIDQLIDLSTPWLMRVKLSKDQLFKRNITLLDVSSQFAQQWDKKFMNVKNIKKNEKDMIQKITKYNLLSTVDSADEPIIHIRFEMNNAQTETINTFVDFVMNNIRIKGIPGIGKQNDIITKKHMYFDKNLGEVLEKEEKVILIDGSNMTDIRNIKNIDHSRSFTNNIREVHDKYGIEAAKKLIMIEIERAYSSKGAFVSYHHRLLLADLMTCTGQLVSIYRQGAQKLDNDCLARASFEEAVSQMVQAGVFSEMDTCTSLSSQICNGLAMDSGTTSVRVHFNEEVLLNQDFDNQFEIEQKKLLQEYKKVPVTDVQNKILTGQANIADNVIDVL